MGANNKAWKSFRRVAFWTVGGLCIAAAIYFAMKPQPVLIDVATAEIGDLQVTIDEDGLTRIKERYVVSTPLDGRLERVQLEVGDSVQADTTVVARMQATDPSLLDPRALAQAEARVQAAERRLEASQVELARAESLAEFAKTEFERALDLKQKNILPDAEFEQKQLDDRVRRDEVRAAKFRVDIAEYELELERAALLLTDPARDLKSPGEPAAMELAIKAPIHGRVLRIYQESAAVLAAGAPIMEIGDPLDLEVVADVLSMDAVRVEPGTPVRLENWGGQQPLRGQVRVVEPSGFTKLSALGVEEQRVNVIIDLLDTAEVRQQLGDGFRVDARIIVWEGKQVLKVPTSALFRIGQAWQLFVLRDGIARQVSVQLGENNGIEAQILEGVDAGEQVIVHPSDQVRDGVAVALRDDP